MIEININLVFTIINLIVLYLFNEKVLIWSDPQCDGAEKKT